MIPPNRAPEVLSEPSGDDYATAQESARLLGVSRTRVQQLIHREKLEAVRFKRRYYIARSSIYARLKTEKVPPHLKQFLEWVKELHAGSVPREVIDNDPNSLIPRRGNPRNVADYFFPTKKAAAYREPIHRVTGEILKAARAEHWAGVELGRQRFWEIWQEYEFVGKPIDPEVRAALAKPIPLFDSET